MGLDSCGLVGAKQKGSGEILEDDMAILIIWWHGKGYLKCAYGSVPVRMSPG